MIEFIKILLIFELKLNFNLNRLNNFCNLIKKKKFKPNKINILKIEF
jgi:hypothetical protein